LESSQAACRCLSALYRPSARHVSPVRRRCPVVHVPVKAGYHGDIFVVRCRHLGAESLL
jgi:hypothetical protein